MSDIEMQARIGCEMGVHIGPGSVTLDVVLADQRSHTIITGFGNEGPTLHQAIESAVERMERWIECAQAEAEIEGNK